ncbi:MAG: hypothetical protein AAF810_27590 [Cyanobacteria bacterium P01_D01_bin.36]
MTFAEKLRDEIQALQISLRDLFKWKLVLTGTVTAIGLGLTGSAAPSAYLSLGAVPLIVTYCDLLMRDYELRIRTIALYLSIEEDSAYSRYENFLHLREITRIEWWIFGDMAIQLSSLIACILVLCVAAFHINFQAPFKESSWVLLVITSVVGIAMVSWIQQAYQRKSDELWRLSDKMFASQINPTVLLKE